MRRQQGFLIIVAIILISIIGLLSAILVRLFYSTLFTSSNTNAANYAYELAASAIEVMGYQLDQTPSLTCNGSVIATISLSNGQYRYSCQRYSNSTTTTTSITATSTTIPVTSSTGFPSVGAVMIGAEIIYYYGVSGNNLINCVRGLEGTTASSATSGRAVNQFQYILMGEGASPSFTSNFGLRQISQAANYKAFGVGASGAFFTYQGGWAEVDTAFGNINAVSCPTSTKCLAVGDSGRFYNYDGTSWTLSQTIGSKHLHGIDCVSSNFCMAVGEGDNSNYPFFIYNGSTWARISPPTGLNLQFNAVSCPSSTSCKAVGNNGAIYTYNGSAWSLQATFSQNIMGVSCPTTSMCVAVGDRNASNSGLYIFNGSSWGQSAILANESNLTAVSCPSSTQCFAVGDQGKFYFYNSGVWSGPVQTSTTQNLTAINCISVNDCKAGGASGTLFAYNGSSWLFLADLQNQVNGISIPKIPSMSFIYRSVDPVN